jgi:hypothetical protein
VVSAKSQVSQIEAQIQLKQDEFFGLQKQLDALKSKMAAFIK